MMLKRSRLAGLMAAGLLLASAQVPAVDVPVKITGTILIPPCTVNDGQTIEVDFGDVSVTDVDNARNQREKTVKIDCSYSQGKAYVKVTGDKLEDYVLKTKERDNFGIALYQGKGTATKLILGDGQSNGKDAIGYPITSGLSGNNFTFTAVPYKKGSEELTAGAFTAIASMSISYL